MANKQLFSGLGSTPKDKIFSLALIVLILVAGYFGIRKIISMVKSSQMQEKNELSNLLASGQRLSYTDSQYKTFADKLYTAMKGFGTDEKAVYDVFNAMNNDADLLKLITTFGVRGNENLTQWLADDGMLKNNKINNILSSKGIKYQF